MTIEASTILGITGGIVALILSSIILTSTIEELGTRGKFSSSFTGAVISPIFTSMPELVIIVTAWILIGKISGSEIAAGTIIGEPFMVSAIGFPLMAVAMLLARKNGKAENLNSVMPKTLIFIGLVFPVMVIPSLINSLGIKIITAFFLVAAYLIFVYFVRGKNQGESEPLRAKIRSKFVFIALVVVGVVLVVGGSTLLVRSVDTLAFQSSINRELIAILIVPIATIVPETLNSVIWAAKLKTNLAVGALVGEESFFATFYPALGILASTWVVTSNGLIAIILTSVFSITVGLVTLRYKGGPYVYFLFVLSLVIFLTLIYL